MLSVITVSTAVESGFYHFTATGTVLAEQSERTARLVFTSQCDFRITISRVNCNRVVEIDRSVKPRYKNESTRVLFLINGKLYMFFLRIW